MRVVCFPGGEEHRQHWHKSSKSADLGRAVSNSRGLQQASKSAVQRVDPVTALGQSRSGAFGSQHILKELSKRTRSPGTARLLSVDVVHGGVHPHAKGEAVVYP